MSEKEVPKQGKRYELVAPDGSWGYMIWIAVIINLVAVGSFVSCIGMMFSEIYIQLDMGSTAITLLNGVGSICISISGFVTGPLLHCMSYRTLGLAAAIIFNVGAFGIVFVNSTFTFFLFYGLIQSLGNGILYNISVSMLNEYFVNKRMLAVTVTQTVTALVALFTSQFVKWTANEYGHRGTLILISALYMHVFVAISLMQPVQWHMKKIEIVEDEETEMKLLLVNEGDLKEKSDIPTIKLSDAECVSSEPASIQNKTDNNILEDTKKDSKLKHIFKDFFDASFVKSFLLSNASIGLAVSAFSEVTFLLMLPQALYASQWSESDVAWAISLSNLVDLVTRVIFIILNKYLHKFGSQEIYVAGLIITFFTKLGMLWSDNPMVMLIFIAIMGIPRCIIIMFIPLVISESVDKDKFTTALGIFMLLYGTLFLVLGPIIGAIRDLTNSYGTAFYIITSCYGIVVMFWLIELLYKKNKHKRMPKKDGSA